MKNKTIDHVFSSMLAILQASTPQEQQREIESRRNFILKSVEKYNNGEFKGSSEVSDSSAYDLVAPESHHRFGMSMERNYVALQAKYDKECKDNDKLRKIILDFNKTGVLPATEEKTVCSDATEQVVTFGVFRKMAEQKFEFILPEGSDRGWQQAFITASNGEFKFNHLTSWRKAGKVPKVPARAIELLQTMSAAISKPTAWSDEERQFFKRFIRVTAEGNSVYVDPDHPDKKMTEAEVAEILQKTFGRPITLGVVKGKKRDMFPKPKNKTPANLSKSAKNKEEKNG